jgi:DNA-binding MarR family transcriptional regulator
MSTTAARLNPSQLAAWRSLAAVHAGFTARVDEALAAEALPPRAWLELLVAVDGGEGGLVRPRDLACQVALTKSGLTRLVDRMAEAGLVERQACERDRRGHYLRLTDAGMTMLARMRPIYEEALAESFGGRLTPADVRTLAALLDRARPEPPGDGLVDESC